MSLTFSVEFPFVRLNLLGSGFSSSVDACVYHLGKKIPYSLTMQETPYGTACRLTIENGVLLELARAVVMQNESQQSESASVVSLPIVQRAQRARNAAFLLKRNRVKSPNVKAPSKNSRKSKSKRSPKGATKAARKRSKA